MIVLEKPLSKVYPEIDMVTTPDGSPVAMVHCNNCTTDLDSWIGLLKETVELMSGSVDVPKLYDTFYNKALEGAPDCGGLLSYNYYSGEHTTGFEAGRPLFTKLPDSKMNLANFARAILFSTMATLKFGMNILTEKSLSALTDFSATADCSKPPVSVRSSWRPCSKPLLPLCRRQAREAHGESLCLHHI